MAHPSNPGIKVILIAAVDRNGALGREGTLPWRCPVDMRHFVACTTDKMVVMGRKTADGFAKPLRNRTNIVMTRSGQYPRAGFQVASRVQEVMDYADHAGVTELWIIGGGCIYELWLPYADIIHLTEIDVEVEDADTWFPVEGMGDFAGTSVTTVEDPLVRFWTLQRARVGTRRDMPQSSTSAVVMDLNQPVAIWTADGGTRDIDTFMAGLGDQTGDT